MEHEQGPHQLTGYEPNAARALGPGDSAFGPVHVRSMLMQELTIEPELLNQMNAWANQTAQSQQDAAILIQELFRRTQVLGEAVQQIPRSLCDQVREQLQADLAAQEKHMIDLTGRVTVLENLCRDVVARLNALEIEVSNQRSVLSHVQQECQQVESLKFRCDALHDVVAQHVRASDDTSVLHVRVEALQDMMNHVANQLDELVAVQCDVARNALEHDLPDLACMTPRNRRPEHFVMSPEVISCSLPQANQPSDRTVQNLPEVPPLPFARIEPRAPPAKSSSSAGPLPAAAAAPIPAVPQAKEPSVSVATASWSHVGASDVGHGGSAALGGMGGVPESVSESSLGQSQGWQCPPGLPNAQAHAVASMAVSEGNVGLGDYKYMKQSPALSLTGDRTWEKCMALDLWFQQMSITASAVGKGMESHWRFVLAKARDVYSRNQSLSIAERVTVAADGSLGLSTLPQGSEQLEGKLLVALMAALPEEIKRPMLEAHPSRAPTSLELVHQALEWCAPGGKEDRRSLLEFVRRPGGAFVSAADCRARLRSWRSAKHRLTRLGLSQPPPTELLMALEEIVASMERKHESLRFALQAARLASEVRQPAEQGVLVFEQQVEQELMMLEQDERTRSSAQGIGINAVRESPKRKPCHFFAKPGGCSRNPCPYEHVKPDKPSKAEPKTPSKAQPKQKGSPKGRDGSKGDGKGKGEGKGKAKPKVQAKAAEAKAPTPSVEVLASMLHVQSDLEARLQSVDAAMVKDPLPWVLVDSGANQVLRPWDQEVEKELGQATPLNVTLASGEMRQGWKTCQGEVVLPRKFSQPHAKTPWILPVSRLVQELGYQVVWKPAAVELVAPSGNKVTCVMRHDLPHLKWKDFKGIRKQLAKSSQRGAVAQKCGSLNAGSAEEDEEAVWSTLTRADEVDAAEEGDVWCSRMLCLEPEAITASARIREIQAHALEEVAKAYLSEFHVLAEKDLPGVLEALVSQLPYADRFAPRQANEASQGKTNSVVIGLYQHGSFSGVTTWTHRIPHTVKLINAILAQQLPHDAVWTSIQMSKNAQVAPHRDSRNQGVSYLRAFGDFEGGKLWVEDPAGQTEVRHQDKMLMGTLYPTKGHWLKLNAKHLVHSVEKFLGTRISVSVYTAGTGKFVTHEMGSSLSSFGFKLPMSHRRYEATVQGCLGGEAPCQVDPWCAGIPSNLPSRSSDVLQDQEYQPAPDMRQSAVAAVFGKGVVEHIGNSEPEDIGATVCFGPLSLDADAKDEHARCGHVPSRPDCEACQEALGLRRIHRKVPVNARSTAVLSLDLTGPHPRAFETHAQYALIAVATLDNGLNLVYGVPVLDKTSAIVLTATRHVLGILRSLFGGKLPIAQVHSDCGGEFVSNLFRSAMQEIGVFQTTSQPGDKAQNGRAERYVGIVKQKTVALLQEGKLPVTMWAHVLPHAFFLLRQSALARTVPSKLPVPGDCVIVPAKEQAVREGGDFVPKVKYGVFIGIDETIPEGAIVAVRDGVTTSLTRVSGPKKWKSADLKRWRMHTHPTQADKAVWVSSVGDVVWSSPHSSAILAFEERRPAPGPTDVAEFVRRGIPGLSAQQYYSLYMHSYEAPEEIADTNAVRNVEYSWLELAAHQANLVREACHSPDAWVTVGSVLIRRHLTPRVNMFEPIDDEVCRSPATSLCADRVTVVLAEGDKKSVVIDRWTEGNPGRHLLPDSRKWRGVTLFGILATSLPEPLASAAVASAQAEAAITTASPKYWLPDPAAETEMHRLESAAANLETHELVNVPVDPKEVEHASEPEKLKWLAGIDKEMSNLEAMAVFDRITQEEYDVWKASNPRLARPLPTKLVLVKKPQPDATDFDNPYNHKARIVVCGNMQQNAQKEMTNRAEVPDAFFTRCILAMVVLKTFCLTVLDVNAAFLYASLPKDEPPVTVSPPGLLKRLGLAGQTELWVLRKALYGLRVSPKCWTKTRNDTVRGVEVQLPDGKACVFQPADSQEHAWVLVCDSGGIVGYALFYVDDILLAAHAANLVAIRNAVKLIWKVKDQGTLLNPADKSYTDEAKMSLNVQSELGFLGMRLGFNAAGNLECHQCPYIRSCLKERGFGEVRGSLSLPAVQEGMQPEFANRDSEEYRVLIRKGQQEIGALLWASQRSRPDIAACVGALGSLLVTHPKKVLEWCHQVWRYLAGTVEHRIVFQGQAVQADAFELSVSADASFAPGGSKSRSGVVAMLNGCLIQWSSTRQSLAAQSAVEAEIQAAGLGCVTAIAILNLMKSLIGKSTLRVELLSDNTGCIANILHTVTTWRDRHFCIRAAALRDQLTEHSIDLKYRSGRLILADALTKVLGRNALELARAALGVSNPPYSS